MRHRYLAHALFASLLAVARPGFADTNPEDCFPVCPQAPAADASAAQTASTAQEPQSPATCPATARLVQRAESVNARIAPVKELAGYVRSPQGLAVKLVNDHVFRIPAWVGFALDPLGTLKRKALEEVRSQAKTVLAGEPGACEEDAPRAPDDGA
jgi:hypothetical protein